MYLSVLLSYLLGAINFSYLIGWIVKGIDIRNYGSGNAGATNTFRMVGKRAAVVAGFLDALKGFLAVMLGQYMDGRIEVMAVCGLAAIMGHNWPVFMKFRGGKGIATTVGVATYLFPLYSLLAFVIAVLALLLLRYVALASLTYTVAILAFMVYSGQPKVVIYVGVLAMIFAFWRHRSNLSNIISGTEGEY